MILTKEIVTSINYLNIEYYRSIGYNDIKCNQKIVVLVSELSKESNLKIKVECDICDNRKVISYQKYNKNISKYDLYSCSNKCSSFKNKKTNYIKYGDPNYSNYEKRKDTVKNNYDIKTAKIEELGYITCIKCKLSNNLENYLKNRNGRYKGICLKCRSLKSVEDNKNRKLNDPILYKKKESEYRLNNKHKFIWREVLRGYLNRLNIKKDDKTLNLLKYTQCDFKKHIELKFDINMNWTNHGEYWHIDHIIPVSAFNIDSPIHIVNSLENLRPLYKIENLSKNNKIEDTIESRYLLDKFKTYIKTDYIRNIY